MDINERIKAERERKRFSQYDMAEMLNISQSAYLQIEKGKTELTVSRLNKIASVLEVSVVDLLGIEPKQNEARTEEMEKMEKEIIYLKKLHESNEGKERVAKRMVQNSLDYQFEKVAYKLDLGTWVFTEVATGKTYEVKGNKWSNIEKLPNHEDIYIGVHEGTYTEELVYTLTEIWEINVCIFEENEEYWNILNDLGLITDPGFKNMIIALDLSRELSTKPSDYFDEFDTK